MLKVMIINPGDEAGFPSRPCEVHSVQRKELPKFLAAQLPGAVTLIIDTDVPVPHPYDKNATLGVDRARRLIDHALKGFVNHVAATEAVLRRRAIEASVAKYNSRIARDKEQVNG